MAMSPSSRAVRDAAFPCRTHKQHSSLVGMNDPCMPPRINKTDELLAYASLRESLPSSCAITCSALEAVNAADDDSNTLACSKCLHSNVLTTLIAHHTSPQDPKYASQVRRLTLIMFDIFSCFCYRSVVTIYKWLQSVVTQVRQRTKCKPAGHKDPPTAMFGWRAYQAALVNHSCEAYGQKAGPALPWRWKDTIAEICRKSSMESRKPSRSSGVASRARSLAQSISNAWQQGLLG